MRLLESIAKQVTVIAKQDTLHGNKDLTLFMSCNAKVTRDFLYINSSFHFILQAMLLLLS